MQRSEPSLQVELVGTGAHTCKHLEWACKSRLQLSGTFDLHMLGTQEHLSTYRELNQAMGLVIVVLLVVLSTFQVGTCFTNPILHLTNEVRSISINRFTS